MLSKWFFIVVKNEIFLKFCSTKNREITRADIEFWEFLNLSSIAKKEELRNWWIICHDLRDNKYYFHALETTENELCSSRADDLAHNQSPLWRQKEKVKENCKSSKPSLFLQQAFFLPGFWEDVSSSSLFIAAVPPSWWSVVGGMMHPHFLHEMYYNHLQTLLQLF